MDRLRDRRVLMSAACKKARDEGEAWVTWRDERLLLAPPLENPLDYFGKTIVYVRSGHFRVTEGGMRKGNLPMVDADGYRISPKQVKAVVVERHEPLPWCEPCGSYHPTPRSREHWLKLQCFAPYEKKGSS